MRPPSITTIAERAGVSRNTVSLALRGDPRVAPATSNRVLKIAESMGYRRNLVARAMVTGRTETLGLVIPRLEFSYMPRLVEAIGETAFASGHGVLTCSHHNRAVEVQKAIEYLLERRVDGLMIYSPVPAVPNDTWSQLKRSSTATVFFGFGHQSLPGITMDLLPSDAGEMAVRRFVEVGHTHLGFAGARRGFFEEARWKGVCATAKLLGIRRPVRFDCEDSIPGGRAAARQLLESKTTPTAVIAFTDSIAAGLIQGITKAGVTIPRDVAVVGADDLPFAEGIIPSLATLRAPATEMGTAAVTALLQQGSANSDGRKWEWEWVERESFGPPGGQHGCSRS